MSRVSYYIDTLKSASTGHHTRNLMVYILSNISEDGPDAKTFNGKRAIEYASKTSLETQMSEISRMLKKDAEPAKDSENLLETRGVMTLVGDLNGYPAHD